MDFLRFDNEYKSKTSSISSSKSDSTHAVQMLSFHHCAGIKWQNMLSSIIDSISKLISTVCCTTTGRRLHLKMPRNRVGICAQTRHAAFAYHALSNLCLFYVTCAAMCARWPEHWLFCGNIIEQYYSVFLRKQICN